MSNDRDCCHPIRDTPPPDAQAMTREDVVGICLDFYGDLPTVEQRQVIVKLRDNDAAQRETIRRLEASEQDAINKFTAEALAHNVTKQQLADMTRERDEAVESTYVPGSWSCPVCQFAQVNSVLCATSGRVGADTESVPLCPNDGTLMKRETWKGYAVAYEKSLVEKLQQLAASQARVREALRFYADPHTYGLNGGTNERIIKDHGQQAQRALKEV